MKYLVLLGLLVCGSSDARDLRERYAFRRTHACPATGLIQRSCPGYVVDHIEPLCKGGLDRVGNMQWQTVADGKAKDRVECKR